MLIGVDIDNVVVNTTEAVLEYINERLPVKLKLSDITTYSIEATLPAQYQWIVEAAFRDKQMWKKVKIIDDAKKYLKKLYKDGHEIYFCTSSLPENLTKKIKHLVRNFDFFDKNYIETHTINIHKKQLLNLDILIDDCFSNLCGSRTYYSLCYSYPWNKTNVLPPDFSYVKNWDEIYQKITEIAAKKFYSEVEK